MLSIPGGGGRKAGADGGGRAAGFLTGRSIDLDFGIEISLDSGGSGPSASAYRRTRQLKIIEKNERK